MSDDNKANDPYPTGTYAKDGAPDLKVETTRDAVQAAFDGYHRVQEDSDVQESGFAAVNDNDPESPLRDSEDPDEAPNRNLNEDYDFDQNAEFSDDQADHLEDGPVTEGDHPDAEEFQGDTVSDTAATPDGASGTPVDRSDPNRSFSL